MSATGTVWHRRLGVLCRGSVSVQQRGQKETHFGYEVREVQVQGDWKG